MSYSDKELLNRLTPGAGLASLGTHTDELVTLARELHDDHATLKTVVDDLKTLVNSLRTQILTLALGNPGLQRVSNFDVNNANAISYLIAGTLYTLAATQTADTGTTKVITADKWAAFLVSVNTSGALTATWTSGAAYSTEALAIAALPAVPANQCEIGYVTVLTGSGVTWTAGTDALAGGTGGTPATTTTYYNHTNGNTGIIGAAVSSSSPATLTSAKPASLN